MAPLVRRPLRYTQSNATLWIIAVNIGMFALGMILPGLRPYLALNPLMVLGGYVWQPLTYMFVHADLSHLALNMLGLFFFGTQVERGMGSREFTLYYLLTGFLAGLLSLGVYIVSGSWYVMLVGASGALFSVMLAFAVLHPDAIIYLWGIVPVRAALMVAGYTAIEVGSQLFSVRSSVAHLTHLAGFLFGWIYIAIRFGVNPWKRLFGRR